MLRFRDFGVFVFDLGCFVFEFWVLRFRDLGASFSILGASFSSFGCFVFEIWVLRFRDLGASCFGLRFRVLRFRNYRIPLLFLRGLNNKNSMLKKFVFQKISTIHIPKSSKLHRYVNKVRKLYHARYKCNNKRDPKIINFNKMAIPKKAYLLSFYTSR